MSRPGRSRLKSATPASVSARLLCVRLDTPQTSDAVNRRIDFTRVEVAGIPCGVKEQLHILRVRTCQRAFFFRRRPLCLIQDHCVEQEILMDGGRASKRFNTSEASVLRAMAARTSMGRAAKWLGAQEMRAAGRRMRRTPPFVSMLSGRGSSRRTLRHTISRLLCRTLSVDMKY